MPRYVLTQEEEKPESPRFVMTQEPAAMLGRLEDLKRTAGERGYTFAGRLQPKPSPLSPLGFSVAEVPNLEETTTRYSPLLGGTGAELRTAPKVQLPATSIQQAQPAPIERLHQRPTGPPTFGQQDDEMEFQRWYSATAKRQGLNPNPDDPRHQYDYRAAFRAGAMPDAQGHWPSQFKMPGHPNRFIGGIDTITGKPVAPAPKDRPEERIEDIRRLRGLRGPEYSLMGPGSESPVDVLAKAPAGELEGATQYLGTPAFAGAITSFGRGAGAIGGTRLAAAYRAGLDKYGHKIMEQIPPYFKAGRGTPIEFREANMQRMTDVRNLAEDVAPLKGILETAPEAQRERIHQLLKPSGPGATQPMQVGGQQRWAGPIMPRAVQQARQPFQNPAGQWIDPDFEMRVSGATQPKMINGRLVEPLTPEQVDAARKLRGLSLGLQDELVKTKALSNETIDRFRDTFGVYFPRMYSQHLIEPEPRIVTAPVTRELYQSRPPWPGAMARAGRSGRLLERGEHIEVDIPDLQQEMNAFSRSIGGAAGEAEFRREFRQAARPLTSRRQRVEDITSQTRTTSSQQTTSSQTSTTATGPTTQIPLSGVGDRLETTIVDALKTRGMTEGEARNATGRLKAIAARVAQQGPEVQVSGGGTTTTATKETIKETIETNKETVKKIIEGLGINNAQRAALHAYYDVITRAGAKAKPITIDGKVYRIKPVMDVESALERVDALDPLLKAGYKVTGREGNKVSLFRDLPESYRARLGELKTEPGYVAAKGIVEASHEVAMRKFLAKVAENPEWAIPPNLSIAGPSAITGTRGGIPVPTPAFRQAVLPFKQGMVPWKDIPNDPKTYGDLAGMKVRPDIAGEINAAIRARSYWEKINGRLNSLWKLGKVTNLPTMGRNILSSAEMAHWGGLNGLTPDGSRSYMQAIQGLRGRDAQGAALIAEARKMPLYGSTFNVAELGTLADGYFLSNETNPVVRFLDGVHKVVGKKLPGVGMGAPELYGLIDHFYKTALYIHARMGRAPDLGRNVTPEIAARYARKYAIDYEDVSPAARGLSNLPLGSPFVRFTSKMVPLAVETAAKHPVRFFALPAAILGINELSKSQLSESEQQELSQVQQGGNLRSPRFMNVGRTPEGRFRFLDLGYQLPYGDLIEVMDLMRGGEGANLGFMPLGGVGGAVLQASPMVNKNFFTGQPIRSETDTAAEAAAKTVDFLGKSLLPAWAPPIPFTGFRGGYSTEQLRKSFGEYIPESLHRLPGEAPMSETDFLGRRRSIPSALAAKVAGIDIKEMSLADLKQVELIKLQAKANDLQKQSAKLMMMTMPTAEKQLALRNLGEKYKAEVEEFKKKFETKKPEKEKRYILTQ